MAISLKGRSAEPGLSGPSIQIDPLFPYYQQRSTESIAEEIHLGGYSTVHYFVVNEHVVDQPLIEAFHRRGMKVWAMVIGNGTFSTDRFPDDWPSWQMKLLKDTHDGFIRLSPFSKGYVQWKKSAMARLVTEYPFDGIEIAEPYFPEWGGIERGVYGDVGPLAQAAFRVRYGIDMPDFINPEAPNYYAKAKSTYHKWVHFRVEAVNGFINEMINGESGVREARPDIKVATWSLAIDAGPDSMARLREEQGLDAPSMIALVRPDIHFLQTHWPDWSRGNLPADYVKKYQPFMDAIRSRFPDLPLAVQADIGSGKNMIRDQQWLDQFEATVWELGLASWTAYEYHIGGYMYEARPVPAKVTRRSKSELVLSFNKRIDENSVIRDDIFTVWDKGRKVGAVWKTIEVDGNRIILNSEQLPDTSFEMELNLIKDTPDRWLYKDAKANTVPAGLKIIVPGVSPACSG